MQRTWTWSFLALLCRMKGVKYYKSYLAGLSLNTSSQPDSLQLLDVPQVWSIPLSQTYQAEISFSCWYSCTAPGDIKIVLFSVFLFFPSYHIYFFFNWFDSLMFYLAPGKTDLHHYRATHTHFAKTNNNHARRQTGEKPDSVHQYGIPSALKGRGRNQENCGTAEQNTGLYYWQNVCHTPNVNISVQKHGGSHKAVPHIWEEYHRKK